MDLTFWQIYWTESTPAHLEWECRMVHQREVPFPQFVDFKVKLLASRIWWYVLLFFMAGAVQHISPGVGTISAGFQSATRPATSTLAVQPQPRVGNISGASQRPLSDCSSPQEAVKSSAEVSPPIGRSATVSSLSRNLNISVVSQSASRPVATVTAQPVVLNRVDTASKFFGC